MKKGIACGVACVMVAVGLLACGGGGGSSSDNNSTTTQNADISGYWNLGNRYMSLSQSGTTVSGFYNSCSNAPVSVSGSVSGNNISLSYTDGGCVNQWTATVSGATMSGTDTLIINSNLGTCGSTPGIYAFNITKLAANPCP